MPAAHEGEVLLSPGFLRKLEALALVSRKLARGSERGERGSQGVGSGIAFASHRAYAAGDDLRFVDWQLYARSERLYVKQYEEERDLTLHMLLDCSRSMALGDKLGYAKQLAAALGYVALANLDRVAVQPYTEVALPRLPPQRGRRRALVLLRYLQVLHADGATNLRAAARAVCVHAGRGGLAYVLSDGLDEAGLLAGVDQLRHARLEPVVLIIEDARELSLVVPGELTLVDSETGEERTVRIDARTLAQQRDAEQQRREGLQRALSERQVPLVRLDVQVPLERALLELLRRGGLVR